jgi:hypothetical protein
MVAGIIIPEKKGLLKSVKGGFQSRESVSPSMFGVWALFGKPMSRSGA